MFMKHYRKSHIKEVYDILIRKGVTDDTFQLIDELPLDYIVEDIISGKDVDNDLVRWVTHILHEVYNHDSTTFITDSDYDELYAINKELNDIDLAGSTVSTTLRKYNHKYPGLRGTVDNVHYIREEDKPIINDKVDPRKSYEHKVLNVERALGQSLKNCPVRLSLKVDGVSGILEIDGNGKCERALKRGDVDSNIADEIIILRNKIFPDMEKYAPCGLKVEIYMNRSNFELFKEKYGHFDTPRSAITSIVNSEELDEGKLQYITIYEIEIDSNGETIMPDNIYFDLPSATNYEAIEVAVDELQRTAAEKGIPADGVVIRFMDESIQTILGREKAINKFEVGFKFKLNKYKAILKEVKFSMGNGGSYTPVAEIVPIDIDGVTVTNISLGSILRLRTLDLRIGQTVYITHSVIPYLYDCPDDKDQYSDKITVPVICRYCGCDLQYHKSKLFCPNESCYMIKQGRLVNYIVKSGIEDISEATVDKLMLGLDIDKIHQLYQLKDSYNTIVDMDGFGPVSAQKIIDSIEKRRSLSFDLLMGSMGILHVGRTTMKTILNSFNTDEFLGMLTKNNFSKLINIKNIGDSVINSLTEWSRSAQYNDFLKLLEEVTILEPKKTLNSHTILFTKVRDYDFQSFLESKGFGISDNYKKNVDVVIYNGDESKKTEKARQDGKPVITLEEAYGIYGYNI